MTIFPPTLYFVLVDYDDGPGNWLDPRDSFTAALDDFAQARSLGKEPRVLRIEFDYTTNLPETVAEVTDELATAALIGRNRRENNARQLSPS